MTDLPAGRHGAYLRAWLIDRIGLPAVRSLVGSGRLVRFSRPVLVDSSRKLDFLTRAAAALFTVGPRAVLTSHSAALLHGCTAADGGVIHVLSGYDRQLRRRDDLALHQGSFDEQDVVERNGLRVLALEAVIAELLCTSAGGSALACADQALAALNPGARAEFRAEVDHRVHGRPDSRGRRRGCVLLDLATGLPESPAESRLLLALFDGGVCRCPSRSSRCATSTVGSGTGSTSRGRSRWSRWNTTATPRMPTGLSGMPYAMRICVGGAGL